MANLLSLCTCLVSGISIKDGSLTRKIIVVFTIQLMNIGIGRAQQFVADNQWVADRGVFTMIGTGGQKYMMFNVVGA